MDLLEKFKNANKEEFTEKDLIIERLLDSKAINTKEAILLLKTIDIKIEADSLTMSSGAKIVGGSDFETTEFGN